MTDQDHGPNLEHAREQGRADLRPFAGVAGVAFPTTLPAHQAVQTYERLLTEAEPHVRWRAHERNSLGLDPVASTEARLEEVGRNLRTASMPTSTRSPWAWLRRRLTLRELERQQTVLLNRLSHHVARQDRARRDRNALVEELVDVRAWLDRWVADAIGYANERTWRRRPLSGPPAWVRTYPASAAFLAEDPRRAASSQRLHDTGGVDFRTSWTWTDPGTPAAAATYWRLSWLPSTREAYVVRRAAADNRQTWHEEVQDPEPVWLLVSFPAGGDDDQLNETVTHYLESLEHLHDDVPRESLLALLDALEATDWDAVLADGTD